MCMVHKKDKKRYLSLWCFYIKANALTDVKEYEKNDKFEIETDEFDTIGQKKI